METLQTIATRRSVRRFADRPLPPDLLPGIIEAACAAPAPHHGRPWRFVEVTPGARDRLIDAMAEAWRADLAADGRTRQEADRVVDRSRRQMEGAPLLLLACFQVDRARSWPDDRRRLAERDMYVQSLGAALQNLLLAAHARGVGGYLKGAPLFCRSAVARPLDLPARWEPAFLVLLGYPPDGHQPPPRPHLQIEDVLLHR